jgi:hypothetical protein
VASIRGQIYSAETLQLGPEGQSRLQDAKTLFQYLQTLIPEPKIYAESVSNSVSDALNKLYPPIIAGISGGFHSRHKYLLWKNTIIESYLNMRIQIKHIQSTFQTP